MPDRPALVVMLLTYGVPAERKDYARIALRSTLANLQYDGPIAVHIADDGTPPFEFPDDTGAPNGTSMAWTMELAHETSGALSVSRVTFSNARRGGYGASYNLGMATIRSAYGDNCYVLPLEDDWELVRGLNATELVDDIAAPPQCTVQVDEPAPFTVGCVRLGYLGHTDDLWANIHLINDRQYAILHPDSPEKHVFTGHPRLESMAWAMAGGRWPEGKDAGTTELMVASREASRTGVAWPMGLMAGGEVYAHIGSVQSYEPERAGAVGGRSE